LQSLDKERIDFCKLYLKYGNVLVELYSKQGNEKAYDAFHNSYRYLTLVLDQNFSGKNKIYAKVHLLFGQACLKVGKFEKARLNFEYSLQFFAKL
jgi:hypothetical protein